MNCHVCKAAEALEWRSLILQTLHHFTYVRAHSPTFPPLYICHSSFYSPSIASPTSQSFSNPSATLPTSQHIVQPFCCFTYAIGTSPMSQVILQSFRCFTYVTCTSRTSPSEPSEHRGMKKVCGGLACYSKLLSLEVATVLDSCSEFYYEQ